MKLDPVRVAPAPMPLARQLPWLAWSLVACSSPLEQARTAFDEARYPDAAAHYRALAPAIPTWGEGELFEYALYRGLSQLALGDARAARRWLTLAKRLAEKSRGLTSPEQQGRLLAAWRAMGHMPGE